MKTEGVHKQTCLARNAKRVLQAEMKRCQLVTQKHIEVHKYSGKGENQNEKTNFTLEWFVNHLIIV